MKDQRAEKFSLKLQKAKKQALQQYAETSEKAWKEKKKNSC